MEDPNPPQFVCWLIEVLEQIVPEKLTPVFALAFAIPLILISSVIKRWITQK